VPAALRRAIIEPLTRADLGERAFAPWRKLKSYVEQASVPLPDRLESYNFLTRTPLAEMLEGEFLAEVDPRHPLSLLREVYQRTASASPVNRMMHLDLKFTLADNDLRKVSRMGEVAGVEVRYPLIDDALVEFSGELPPSYKVRGLKLRYFFKQSLKDFLPPETITKSKHGFGLPFGLWLRNHQPLSDLVQESFGSLRRRGIVRATYMETLLRQHQTTHSTYFGSMIWVLMMLEHWLTAKRL
jgi:asparagine synthase (glutamine-hydrolysing)